MSGDLVPSLNSSPASTPRCLSISIGKRPHPLHGDAHRLANLRPDVFQALQQVAVRGGCLLGLRLNPPRLPVITLRLERRRQGAFRLPLDLALLKRLFAGLHPLHRADPQVLRTRDHAQGAFLDRLASKVARDVVDDIAFPNLARVAKRPASRNLLSLRPVRGHDEGLLAVPAAGRVSTKRVDLARATGTA